MLFPHFSSNNSENIPPEILSDFFYDFFWDFSENFFKISQDILLGSRGFSRNSSKRFIEGSNTRRIFLTKNWRFLQSFLQGFPCKNQKFSQKAFEEIIAWIPQKGIFSGIYSRDFLEYVFSNWCWKFSRDFSGSSSWAFYNSSFRYSSWHCFGLIQAFQQGFF